MLIQKLESSEPGRDVDIAWAAGFWDGEGCVYRDKRNDIPSLQVAQVGNEAVDLLVRFATALGVQGSIYSRSEVQRPPRRDPYYFHARGEQAVRGFTVARPYLSLTKIAQAETAIEAWRTRQAAYVHSSSMKTHCPQGHEYSPENTRLNSRGARTCLTCRRERGLAAYYANLDENRRRNKENQRTYALRRKAARVEVKQEEAEDLGHEEVKEVVKEGYHEAKEERERRGQDQG